MRKLVFYVGVLLLPTAVNAQAFGVKMGSSVAQYNGRTVAGDKFRFRITVPVPNSEFESYVATSTPETGICQISGLGVTHESDEYGFATKAAFSGLKDALTARYGTSKNYDFIDTGALWNKPREWGWSVYKKERTLSSYWSADYGSSLPAGVSIIGLNTKAVSSSGPYVTLTYDFDNVDRCYSLMGRDNDRGF